MNTAKTQIAQTHTVISNVSETLMLRPSLVVPESFTNAMASTQGEAGRKWLEGLPTLVESLCAEWNLIVDGAPMHGYMGLVVPTRRGNELCALKLPWVDKDTAHEAAALATWDGQGAVRLLDVRPNLEALLLERLDSESSLHSVELDEAILVAGRLIRRLAVPAPTGLPQLKNVAARLAESLPERWEQLGRPMSRRLLDTARDLTTQLGPTAGSSLVNHDLHYGNVLAGSREPWLAIDPKVVVGDPEYGLAQLLWTRLEDMGSEAGFHRRFRALVGLAELDPERARSWTLVRCVDYWLWGLSVGFTEDPKRCEAIVNWLA